MTQEASKMQQRQNDILAIHSETADIMAKVAQNLSTIIGDYSKRQLDRTAEPAGMMPNSREPGDLVTLQTTHLRDVFMDLVQLQSETMELCLATNAQCTRQVGKNFPQAPSKLKRMRMLGREADLIAVGINRVRRSNAGGSCEQGTSIPIASAHRHNRRRISRSVSSEGSFQG
jgi:hypothetical protein